MNRKGETAEEHSLVIYNIYAGQREIMKTAYYAEKLPLYEIKLKNGERKMISFFTLKKMIADLMNKYNTTLVYAYNMNFDRRALNNTQKFTTEERFRYFFPYGTEFRCIWNMACQTLLNTKTYIDFAEKNNLISEKDNVLTSAESAYKFLTKEVDFAESHTGLEDVKIEVAIMAKCYATHKKMDTKIYNACWRLPQKKKKEIELRAVFA